MSLTNEKVRPTRKWEAGSVDAEVWRQAFEYAPVPMSMAGTDRRLLFGNQAYAAMLGYDPSEVAALTLEDITRPEDIEWTLAYTRRVLDGDVDSFSTHKIYRRKDGSTVRARLTIRRLVGPTGDVAGLLAIHEPEPDVLPVITDEHLRRIMVNMADHLAVLDANGKLLESTGRYAPVLGYPVEFWADRSVFDVVDDSEIDRLLEFRDRLFRDPGSEHVADFKIRAHDGSTEIVEFHVRNLLDDPEIGGIVVTSRTVTARRRLEEEVARRTAEAEAIAEARSRFVATVSHELRNPLHAISGIAELLASGSLSPEQAPLAEALHRQIFSLVHVVDDLLESSRLSVGSIELRPAPTELRPLLDDVARLGRGTLGGRPVGMSVAVAPDVPPWIEADAGRLRQVLSNLVGNAAKFTDRGSIHIDARRAADRLRIDVTDTGIGIAEDERHSIFEPFRTTGSRAGHRGTGLGLSIVRDLVALMGGSVTLVSRVGVGSTFSLDLPLLASEPTTTAPRPQARVQLDVLVVEDDPVNQLLARGQLEWLGYRPIIVGSGEAALEMLAAGGPGIVLMDYHLPGMDGLETTRTLRRSSLPDGRQPIVIGVTASATTADRAACLAAGMDDFLAKPVGLDGLRDMLERWSPTLSATMVDDGPGAATGLDPSGSPAPEPETPASPRAEPPAPTPLEPGDVVVDVRVLEHLASELGDRATVAALVSTFLAELDHRCRILRDSVGNDPVLLRRTAHTLCSGARLLGATTLADAARAAELCDDPESAAELVPSIERAARPSADQLLAWIAAA